MDETDCIVVGAGAVGLAVARRLAMAGREVVVLEAAGAIGQGVSSRSSEVVHAGLYYPTGSLKARLCVEGRRDLYAFCAAHGVAVQRLGKFVVAGADQADALEALHAQALANGVDDVALWSARDLHEQEPQVIADLALWSPSTGVFDTHGYMLALAGELEDHGGVIALNTPFDGAAPAGAGFEVRTGGAAPMRLACRLLVNAAGLGAVPVAHAIEGLSPVHIPAAHFAQGAYFTAVGVRVPFRHLIYPTPEPGGLGVHVTLDLAGQARFGPDVRWLDAPDYDLADPARAEPFYGAIRRYWPELPDGCLVPAYAGVRPKISGPGEPAADFLIQGPRTTGIDGLVSLFGIESPGLTASLAIAGHVMDLLA
jgi:L-2-hydroxyglutarate oxidase LhgO